MRQALSYYWAKQLVSLLITTYKIKPTFSCWTDTFSIERSLLRYFLHIRWSSLSVLCYSLFTPPTQTRQDWPVLSVSAVWTQLETRRKTVLSCLDPVSNFQVFSSPQYIWDWTVANWKLDRDKTKLSCLVTNCVHTTDMDKTRFRQFFLVRVGSVNKLLHCLIICDPALFAMHTMSFNTG